VYFAAQNDRHPHIASASAHLPAVYVAEHADPDRNRESAVRELQHLVAEYRVLSQDVCWRDRNDARDRLAGELAPEFPFQLRAQISRRPGACDLEFSEPRGILVPSLCGNVGVDVEINWTSLVGREGHVPFAIAPQDGDRLVRRRNIVVDEVRRHLREHVFEPRWCRSGQIPAQCRTPGSNQP
jgi:hypothetical protein